MSSMVSNALQTVHDFIFPKSRLVRERTEQIDRVVEAIRHEIKPPSNGGQSIRNSVIIELTVRMRGIK